MIPILIIAVGSIPIAWVSRRSLLRPSSHGFVRFFAFEAILVLVVTNGRHWFEQPLSVLQLVSWLLLAASLVSVIWGIVLLRKTGEARPVRPDSALYGFENTSSLVTRGIFRYVRHPMYASLLLLGWGAVLKSVGPTTIALGLATTAALYFTARAEERENVARFGDLYQEYMKRTNRFVPFLF